METMKLSEAIRMNGMMKPQGFGDYSIGSIEAPCAIGGALQSVGLQDCLQIGMNYMIVTDVWPWLKLPVSCPVTDCYCGGIQVQAISLIYHLNDQHRWTRAQIADWVELHEPIGDLNDAASADCVSLPLR